MNGKCISKVCAVIFLILMSGGSAPGRAMGPEIVVTPEPAFLFEGSKILLKIKHTESGRFKWDFGDGRITGGGTQQTHIYRSKGVYTIRVEDLEDKFPDPITMKIIILKEGREIVIEEDNGLSANVRSFTAGKVIRMRARKFIKPTVQWDFGDGTIKTAGWHVVHTYKKAGSFKIKVRDYAGKGPKVIKRRINILADPRQITVPSEIIAGEKAQFKLKQAPPGDYLWKFSDGQRFTGKEIKPVIFTGPGRASVLVEDRASQLSLPAKTFTVLPDRRKLKSSPQFALTVEEIQFEALGFRGPVNWDFGDGKVKHGAGKTMTRTYKRPGRYTVKAVDYNGNSEKTFSAAVTVGELTPRFRVNLLELAFNNGKYYQVSGLNEPPPGYYLKIKSSGRGLLKGRWILDGETVGLFEILLKDGIIAELKDRDVFRLPRRLLGNHTLSLAFTNYNFNRRVPVLHYFIAETDAIQVTQPTPGSRLTDGKPVKLTWLLKKKTGETTYQILISETPVPFLTRISWLDVGTKESYIPDLSAFKKGAWIYWQVRAVNSLGRVITTSEIASFKLLK